LKDGDRPIPARLRLADALDDLGVLGVRAVREVQARDVHAGGGEAVELRDRRGRRPIVHTIFVRRIARYPVRAPASAALRNCPV